MKKKKVQKESCIMPEEAGNARTHQDYRAHKGDVGEEVARLGEASCFKLELTGVRPKEVRVHEQAKLGASDEERRDKAPDFRQAAQCNDIFVYESHIVRANQAHVHWHGQSNCEGCESSADQYQKCPLLWWHEELIYRATGGAAQNMSMALMIATRREIHLSILGGVCREY